ncbi:hypothetical protein [Nostoc sp. CHAB 5715]
MPNAIAPAIAIPPRAIGSGTGSPLDRTYAKIAQKLNLSNRQDAKNAKNS